MQFFNDLVHKTDSARKHFESNPHVMAAAADGMPKERYLRFLAELYAIVWHFNPLSAAAAARLPPELRHVQQYLYQHMQEEAGHDEWVLNDVRALGGDTEAVMKSRPLPHTQALVGFNYWTTEHEHPASALGMLYVLEVVASVYGEQLSDALKDSLFLDGEAGVSFLSSHAVADAKHMEDLRLVLDPISDEEAQRAIVNSVIVNYHHLTRVMESVYA